MPLAIQKGVERAKKDLFRVPRHGSTITHQTTGMFGSGRVLLKPAAPGTGVIAGGGVRAVLELAGIHDILSKSLGTQNPINLVKATVAGLRGLRTPEEVGALRGLTINQVLGLGGGGAEPVEATATLTGDAPGDAPAPDVAPAANGAGEQAPEAQPGAPRGVMASLAVTQRRSRNGANPKQLDTLRSLGLRRIGQTVQVNDTPQARGHAARRPPPRRGHRAAMSPSADENPADQDPEQIGLHNLAPAPGSRRPRKRVGRGEGSGHGKTSGRGQKGAGARSGSKSRANFEGGQMPIHMRMRKLRGPHMKKSMPFEPFRTHTQPVNVASLEQRFDAGAEVTLELLREHGLATRKEVPVKILAKGELTKALNVHANAFSAGARQAIEAAGGSCTVVE